MFVLSIAFQTDRPKLVHSRYLTERFEASLCNVDEGVFVIRLRQISPLLSRYHICLCTAFL